MLPVPKRSDTAFDKQRHKGKENTRTMSNTEAVRPETGSTTKETKNGKAKHVPVCAKEGCDKPCSRGGWNNDAVYCSQHHREWLEAERDKFEQDAKEANAKRDARRQEDPHEAVPPRIHPFTDVGNAERFAFRYGGEFVWTEATGWMVYKDGVWVRDKEKLVDNAMVRTMRRIVLEAELVPAMGLSEKAAEAKINQIVAFAEACESDKKIKDALSRASADSAFARNYAMFDRKDWYFNCANGTIDLRSMEFLPHDPIHLLTKKSPIKYDPAAECPKWEQFTLEIMDGKKHMRAYLARCCGYTFTSETGGQCFFMPWGVGGSGKSTLLNVLRMVMGDYCKTADAEMFMAKRGDSGQPFEMAGMEGVRLLMAIETEEGKKLALAKLKRMTGQDPVTACYKFQNQYSFIPQWKVWLATNDAPTTRSDDDAFWDRAKPIPFNVKFRGTDKEIKDYADILVKEEGSGILNWCLAGMSQYKEKGLAHPEDVAQAAEEWRDRDDWLQRFLDDNTVKTDDKQKFELKSEMFASFSRWADQNKEARHVDEKTFTQAMRRKGLKDDVIKRNGKAQRVWLEIRLATFVERGMASASMADPKEF